MVRRLCQADVPAAADNDHLDCVHRGEETGQALCKLCGGRELPVVIYQCSLHQAPCTVRRYKAGSQPERDCLSCPDRRAPASENPPAPLG